MFTSVIISSRVQVVKATRGAANMINTRWVLYIVVVGRRHETMAADGGRKMWWVLVKEGSKGAKPRCLDRAMG